MPKKQVRKSRELENKPNVKFPLAGYLVLLIGVLWIIASLTELVFHWAIGLIIVIIGVWILLRNYGNS